jgi:hypothetical protein
MKIHPFAFSVNHKRQKSSHRFEAAAGSPAGADWL